MKRWLSSIIDVRKGEILVTTLMVLNIYIILVTYYLLKPARDSLFISVSGAKNLPLVFVLIALVVVPVTTLYSYVSRSLKLNKLINLTAIFVIINLVVLRWLISFEGQEWVVYLFYIWVSIYGALMPAQFWLLANGAYDASQSKRIFLLFALAAILGASSGGEITNFLLKAIGVSTENLLFFCMGFIALTIPLVSWTWAISGKEIEEQPIKTRRKGEEVKPTMGEVFKDIKSSRYLMMIIGVIIMTMIIATFVDYLLKAVAEIAFTPAGADRPDKQELTAFFGKYYGRVSFLSFLVQFFLSYRILKAFGVGGAILFLPISQLFGAVAMSIAPGLTTGVILRGSGDVFKYSIDKTGRELLFLPVPLDVKKRVKVFIDVLIDRWFRGLAGGILFIFTAVLVLEVRFISLVVVGIVLLWIILAISIRKQYINAFRQALYKGEIDPAELTFKISDASTVNNLIKSLDSSNERQVSYALGLLIEVQSEPLAEAVLPFLKHPNAEIRRHAVEILYHQKNGKYTSAMEALLQDENPDVRVEALRYIHQGTEKNPLKLLNEYLDHKNFRLCSAALGYIAKYGTENEKVLVDERLIQSFFKRGGREGELSRQLLARALGGLPDPQFRPYIQELMKDPSAEVVKEMIVSIGHMRDRESLPRLVKMLSDHRYRAEARAALANFGERIIGTLNDYLIDASVSMSVRRNIPRVLKLIPTQPTVEVLSSAFSKVNPELKNSVLRALNSLRTKYPDLTFNKEHVENALRDEAKKYYQVYQVFQFYRNGEADNQTADKILLKRALREKLDKSKEQMFRLLALQYPAGDIYNAYLGIESGKKTIRASGIEFLENLLHKEIKEMLMPIVDETSPGDMINRGRRLFNLKISGREEGLQYLIRGNDPWLKACALFTIDFSRSPELRQFAEAAREDSEALVRETADLVLKR
jgi:ATP/ADP translocase